MDIVDHYTFATYLTDLRLGRRFSDFGLSDNLMISRLYSLKKILTRTREVKIQK
jgi:hypothetical protein